MLQRAESAKRGCLRRVGISLALSAGLVAAASGAAWSQASAPLKIVVGVNVYSAQQMPVLLAIDEGFFHARSAIVDSNVSTILTAAVLYQYGTGPVKGFAVSLIAGILTSMYTAVSVSRALATLIYGRRRKLKSIAI